LLLQNPEINTLLQIQHYFFRYYHFNNKQNIIKSPNGIYDYYNLDLPSKEWPEQCIQQNCII